jgi:hypothetical protein
VSRRADAEEMWDLSQRYGWYVMEPHRIAVIATNPPARCIGGRLSFHRKRMTSMTDRPTRIDAFERDLRRSDRTADDGP